MSPEHIRLLYGEVRESGSRDQKQQEDICGQYGGNEEKISQERIP